MSTTSNSYYETKSRRRLELTRHAGRRSGQRGISAGCVPLILAYGERDYDGHGGVRYLMTGKSVANLGRAMGRTQRIDTLVGCYALSAPKTRKP